MPNPQIDMETPKIKSVEEAVEVVMTMTVSNQFVYDTMNMEQKALFTQDIRKATKEALTQDRASLHTSLVAAVKETKEFMAVASSPEFEMGYQMAIKDYEERVLTIINSIFKE